jgi:hypothetical protein
LDERGRAETRPEQVVKFTQTRRRNDDTITFALYRGAKSGVSGIAPVVQAVDFPGIGD